MKVAVAILTHNLFRYGRHELFRQTLTSLLETEYPFELHVFDNGSTDATPEYVARFGATLIRDDVSTCGHGMNVAISSCVARGVDLVVFSNDDIYWHPGYLEQVVTFWQDAPPDVLICSGSLEPDYPWNTPRELIISGGVKALVRDTAPGGTWTLRARDWGRIGPVPEAVGWDDVPTCRRLNSLGYRVAQIDVADHVGEDHSTWGNNSRIDARPLDREKWGL